MTPLYTTVIRTDPDGDTVECEAAIHFTVDSYTPGYAATWTRPGEGAEIECSFDRAELVGLPVAAPLTDAELATLRAWFEANHDQAYEAANDNHDNRPDPDDARERAVADAAGWRGLEA